MKVKVFQIRISDQFQKQDEKLVSDFVNGCEIVKVNTELIKDEINYWSVLVFYKEDFNHIKESPGQFTVDHSNKIAQADSYKSGNSKRESIKLEMIEQPSEEELIIYNKLKDWRSDKAREYQLPPYIIFHNTHLMLIARRKPSTLEDLEHVSGIGRSKIDKYGAEIIEVLENA